MNAKIKLILWDFLLQNILIIKICAQPFLQSPKSSYQKYLNL